MTRTYHNGDKVYDTDLNDWNARIDANTATLATSGRRSGLPSAKLKGGNIVPKPDKGPSGLWAEWDWNNWIKPQVDRAMALGLNAIRLIGAPQVIFTDYNSSVPKITQAKYDSQWRQLAQYTSDNGLLLYPGIVEHWLYKYLTGSFFAGPYNWQDTTAATCVTTTAAVLAEYENVIAFDVFQEGTGQDVSDGSLTLADVLVLYAQIRAVAPTVPLTTSMSGANPAATDGFDEFWSATNWTKLSYQLWTATGGADFVDLHLYEFAETDLNPGKLDGILRRTKMPLLFGEYGAGQDKTSAARASLYRGVAGMHNREGVLGSFAWGLADQGAATNRQLGVYDNTGFTQTTFGVLTGTTPLSVTSGKRTEMTDVLRTFNCARQPTPDYKQPNLLHGFQSRPTNNLTRWSGDSNTSAFGGPHGLEIRPLTNGVTIGVGLSSSYRVPVTAGVFYRFDAELLADTAGRTVEVRYDWYNSSGTFLSSNTAITFTTPTTVRQPLRLSIVDVPITNAAFVAAVVRILSTVATTEHYWLLSNPPPYLGNL